RSSNLIIAILIAAILAIALASNTLNLFSLVGQKVIGGVTVKYEVDPTPPIKVTVDDLGKTYTFTVKLTFKAPSSHQPASIIPLFQPSSYYEIQNPLTVPAKIKSPTGSPITFRGLEPFAIALDPETGKFISPYNIEKYLSTATKTKTETKTTHTTSGYVPPYVRELPSSDNYIPPGRSYLVDPTLYYKPSHYVEASQIASETDKPAEERDHYEIYVSCGYGGYHYEEELALYPGETKTLTFEVPAVVGKYSLGVTWTTLSRPIDIGVKVAWVYQGFRHHPIDSAWISFKPFTALPLSKGVHIQNVVTDAETGEVSYEILNDWIKPIKIVTGITDGTRIVSVGNVEKKTLTIPPQGRVKVKFTVDQVKTFFHSWHPGQSKTFTKTISACIIPEGEQVLFSHGGGGQKTYQCISALAVWKYIPPEVEIGLEVSGQGSVIVKHHGKTVTPPFKARIGDTVTVEMRGAEGYVVGVYGFKKPDGKYLYYAIGGSSLEEHEAPKEKTWSFVVKSSGKIFVHFVVPKSVRTYTTKVGNKTKTAVILPSGEEFIKPEHPLASECLTFAVKVKYSGHVVNAFNPKKWEEKERLQGSMKIVLIAENTCPDDPIEVRLGIHLGGPINTAAMYAERHAELKAKIEPDGRVEKSLDISLDGLTVYRASGDHYRLHFEYSVQARYPHIPGDSWKAVPPYSIPVLVFTPAEKAYSQTGGIIHKPRPEGTEEVEFAPKATEAGVQYPEVQLVKEPGDKKVEASGSYGTGLTESYQPVKVELKHQPSGEKIETTGVIEPPIASEHETDPGVVSFTPKPPSKSPWQQILEFFQAILEWFLSLLGLR
ncbi:MAG: hypothetical protein DRP08_05370, partial [Candidatus Aenigmatarchaeota archaeon]